MTAQDLDLAWEQFRVEVDQDLADELASRLGEILPGGVVLEKLYGDLFPHELDQYQGPVQLSGYYPKGMGQEIREKVSFALEKSGQEELIKKIIYSPLKNRNWATAWQERYRPIPIGERLIVVPSWLENPFPERIPIWMEPGMAFGSGTHPTTQLCLALLERSVIGSPPAQMIDVGCGSGILSIAASKLGVQSVLGLDVDPDAVLVSFENARKNRVSSAVSFLVGSVKDVLSQIEPAPLTAANIIAPILRELFEEGLGELVLPGGRIILSGILREQLPEIHSCLKSNGFVLPQQHQMEDWVGVIAEKSTDL